MASLELLRARFPYAGYLGQGLNHGRISNRYGNNRATEWRIWILSTSDLHVEDNGQSNEGIF